MLESTLYPTLSELLVLPEIKTFGLRLLAGQSGSDRIVRWAHVVDVSEPEKWLRSGDLFLTSRVDTSLSDRLNTLSTIVSGIVISIENWNSAAENFIRNIVPLCDSYNLPLLLCPWNIKFADLTETIHRHILSRHTKSLETLLQVHAMLTQAASGPRPIQSVTETLGRILSRPVAAVSNEFDCIEVVDHGGSNLKTVLALLFTNDYFKERLVRSRGVSFYNHDGVGVVCMFPYTTPIGAAGYILVVNAVEDKFFLQVCGEAAVVLSLVATQQYYWEQINKTNETSIIDRILSGQPLSDGMKEWLTFRGFTNAAQYFVIVVLIREAKNECIELIRKSMKTVLDSYRFVTRELENYFIYVIRMKRGSIEEIKTLLDRWKHSVGLFGCLSVGASGVCHGLNNVRAGYEQALTAAKYAKDSIAVFPEIFTLNLISELGRDRCLQYLSHSLGAIYKNKILLDTLFAFIDNDFNRTRTAAALNIHRNSLNYRLRLIEGQLGKKLSGWRVMSEYVLAREMYRIFEGQV